MTKSIQSALVLALVVALVPAGALFASAAYDKGLADGVKFGREAGTQKGLADGRKAGEAAGFAKGMEDERTQQPPPGGSEPEEPPTTAASVTAFADGEMADRLGQTALNRFPDLLPRASELPTTGAAPAADPGTEFGIDYSKGFAIGLATGLAETYPAARVQGYQEAYPEGYTRGRAEYKRLYRREDGTVIGPQAQYELGRQALLLNRHQEAIERFDIAIAAEGAGEVVPKALYYKAKSYYDWAKPGDALKTLAKLLAEYPDDAIADDGMFLTGAACEKSPAAGLSGLFGKKRYPEARNAYKQLVTRFPASPILADAYFRLGYSSEKVGDKPAAREAYRTVVERFPESPLAAQARERLKRLGEGR